MDKVLSLLGFAKKARKIVTGTNKVIRSILSGRSFLVIVTEDAGLSIKNKMIRLCDENLVPYMIYGSNELLGKATGEMNKVTFSIEDENFAKSIMNEI